MVGEQVINTNLLPGLSLCFVLRLCVCKDCASLAKKLWQPHSRGFDMAGWLGMWQAGVFVTCRGMC